MRHLTLLSVTAFAVPTADAWAARASALAAHSLPSAAPSVSHHARTVGVRFMSLSPQDEVSESIFRIGDPCQVEVISFGPLGASVHVVGVGHSPDNLIPETEPPLAQGLVLQKEIHYFRQARNGVDVIRGEVLPAFVQKIREDNKLDISLRRLGGKAKAEDVSKLILERLEWEPNGRVAVGDKSPPELVGEEFPGVSKGAFKKAVSALYKKGLVQPGPDFIELMNKEQE